MRSELNGFEVEVTVKDGTPHVRVSFRDGNVIVDTSALSLTGMENMADVFTRAAQMTYAELDIYWQRQRLTPES